MKSKITKFAAIHLLILFIFLHFFIIHSTQARNIRNPINTKPFNSSSDVLVIMSSGVNVSAVFGSFNEFKKIFGVQVSEDKRIAFKNGEDLRSLIQQLENPKYTTIIYVLANGTSSITNNQQEENANIVRDYVKGRVPKTFSYDFSGYCDVVSKEFGLLYNKNIIFWPCPKMKKTEKFLPSYETISFAIKSTAQEFNWTEAVIFATDPNWGLPLAIAANLHTPYRIEIGIENIEFYNIKDKHGKVLIVCSPLNSPATSRIINQFKHYQNIKILLIDIIGNIFNHENQLYKTFNASDYDNLLVLTILTDKFKYILNSKYHVEFSRYLSLKNSPLAKLTDTNSSDMNANVTCDLQQQYAINYNMFLENVTLCEHEMKERCNNTNEDIKNFCTNISSSNSRRENEGNVQSSKAFNDYKFNKQLVFSEYFNLFDFITSMFKEEKNTSNSENHQFDFIVLDFKNILSTINQSIIIWRPFMILQQNEFNRSSFIMHHALSDYFGDWMRTTQNLWRCGAFCIGIIAAIVLVLISFILITSLSAGIAARNYFLKKRLSKGPNKIVLAPTDFVFPVDSRRVDEGIEAMLCCWLQQLQEFGGPEVDKVDKADKPDLLKGSIGSLKNLGLPITAKNSSGTESLVRHNAVVDYKARYQGDLVQLKEIQITGSSVELKNKAMDLLIIAHGLRHENLNTMIGYLSDPNRTALVYEHCSRGSLQDVLIMDEIKLDWSFRLSLLTDLVRGMRYLHSTPLKVHGALSSRNCVVDARWVLKITDYGLPAFYDAQGIIPPVKNAKEFLWTAPEALRGTKNYPKYGTQAADVYSFGIIMQEVVVRGEPYCMLSLSPEEIIGKIKKPPPLIRPSVSKGAAPPEAINIMRQCWAENPDMRPDFVTIAEKFKDLNQGRKVNFVDTMFQMLEKYSNNLEELIRERTDQLDMERKKTEQLLNRMLPSSVAEKLKLGLAVDPEEFAEVTIYFSDIVGFTSIAAHCSPVQVVDLLNDLYTCFDATIMSYNNVYKVETIGDAYMVVGGLPVPRPDHAEQIATMALDLLHQSGNFKVKHLPGVPLQLRIGLHTGPCCAGVVGLTMPRYCLFGDTVNTASRMESTGSSWRIHMSQETCDLLEKAGGYIIESRGPIEIKGKGKMNTYWLLGKQGFDKILPTPPPIGESHGLDELLMRKCDTLVKVESCKIGNATSMTGSNQSNQSSHTPSFDSFDVKVEITPAPPTPILTEISMQNSFSVESASSMTLCSDFSSKSQATSPQPRKFSEMSHDGSFLNPLGNFNRMNPSPPNSASQRLFKRIEEMIDLSLPYNHYKCLSPSEQNLSMTGNEKMLLQVSSITNTDSNKPGSSRLLRRQFSLDKDDITSNSSQNKLNLETISSLVDSSKLQHNLNSSKPQYQQIMTSCSLPSSNPCLLSTKLHKQQSASVAVDLEKIEEIPVSPINSAPNHNNSVNDLNKFKSSNNNNNKKTSPSNSNKKERTDVSLNFEALSLR